MPRPSRRAALTAALLALLATPAPAPAAEITLNDKHFTLPDGYTLSLAASAPLTERPICVDFDEQGRLYVAESSGTNDNVQKQFEDKPHSILRLEDTDGDGVFDRRTVFADRMMFPEGCEWHDGSLYVSAPPHIWKLTDTNDDGVADDRIVWHDGHTLTGCANDLHGPYVGPDGVIYWCKGAFAEQSYTGPDGKPFVTKASHIFRHDPRTGAVEPVLTGGMDNPVEVAFTRDGEPILTCTFFQHPAGGNRDGLIHAAYGGAWGKDHGVLDGHPRTGDLMPPLVHLGAAAPSGLTRLEGLGWGDTDVLLASSFNLHKVSRHVLKPDGGTFATTDDDLLVCDDVDFHPTDVIEDADGSLLIVDTGGWYKLCCPTSQLHKPEVAGAIYRLRRADHPRADQLRADESGAEDPRADLSRAVDPRADHPRAEDPRGLRLDWTSASPAELVPRLHDARFAVRNRAVDEIAKRGTPAVPDLRSVLEKGDSPDARRLAVWTLTRIDAPEARAAVRQAIADAAPLVRRSAIRSAGLWRDPEAAASLRPLLRDPDSHTRRSAAEALARIGDTAAVPDLLAAAGTSADDRFLHHAMTYALLTIGDAKATRTGLAADSLGTVRAALFALAQMPGGNLEPADVLSRLDSPDPTLRDAAAWVLERNPEWGPAVADHLARKLRNVTLSESEAAAIVPLLARFASSDRVRDLIADISKDAHASPNARAAALRAMASESNALPPSWTGALAAVLDSGEPTEVALAVSVLAGLKKPEQQAANLREPLRRIAASSSTPDEIRLQALRLSPGQSVDAPAFTFARSRLTADSTGLRLLAADLLAAAPLTPDQLRSLAEALPDLGPMELDRVLPAFEKATDDSTGLALVEALKATPSAVDILPERLAAALAKYGPDVATAAAPLLERPKADEAERRARLDEFLATTAAGDPSRGHAIFQSSKAACSACHAVGYLGGRIGPDLSGIAKIRTDRDLLEAILFPSASFVRSYEPVVAVTTDGQVHAGIPKEDTDSVTLVTAADKTVTVPRDEIEEMRPGTVSIMPAGLEKQLTPQDLADLLAYLKATK